MVFVFGDCEIDVERRELRRAGEAAHVEPQVFDLLVHLIRHRDRVVGKDELIETVWAGRIVSEATLTSRIGAARRAIGDTGKRQNYLRTIARRGFRFAGEVGERSPAGSEITPQAAGGDEVPAGQTTIGLPRAERPSIAVMPFTNLSGDAAQEYFADGIAEDLIAGLSRVRWLRVVARSSSFSYKGKLADPKDVSRDLGVWYVVDGSVRRAGESVRVSIELVDAPAGIQIWSAHYRRELKDIFAVQDEIAQKILGAIEPELAAAEWERARGKSAENLDAWDHYRRGTFHLYRFGPDDIAAAQRHCRAAIAADAEFPQPYAALAYASHLSLIFDYAADRAAVLDEGLNAGRRAVQLDDRDSFAHAILGRLHMMARDFDLAIAETRVAIERNPYSAQAYFGLGFALVVAGEPEQAIEPLLRAVELSPRDPNLASYGTVLSTANILLNRPTEAAEWAQLATRQPSSHFIAHMHLVVALAQLDDTAGAQKARRNLLRLKPDFSAEYVTRVWPFRRSADAALIVDGLRKAGL
jgi:TolB-like protein